MLASSSERYDVIDLDDISFAPCSADHDAIRLAQAAAKVHRSCLLASSLGATALIVAGITLLAQVGLTARSEGQAELLPASAVQLPAPWQQAQSSMRPSPTLLLPRVPPPTVVRLASPPTPPPLPQHPPPLRPQPPSQQPSSPQPSSPAPASPQPSSPTPAPPPQPLPTPPPPPTVVDRINARYREGGPFGHNLSTAGVLVHQFDTIDEPDPSNAGGRMWLLSVAAPRWSDRISASLISAALAPPRLYSDVLSGLVFSPSATRILCTFPQDASTQQDRVCDPPGLSARCVPGCSVHGRLTWCEHARSDGKCAFRPDDWGGMLAEQSRLRHRGGDARDGYNEVIVDAAHFADHLPTIVEAIFFMGRDSDERCTSGWRVGWTTPNLGRSAGRRNHCERYARAAHAHFLARFGLTATDVPLLRLDLARAQPFEAVHER